MWLDSIVTAFLVHVVVVDLSSLALEIPEDRKMGALALEGRWRSDSPGKKADV